MSEYQKNHYVPEWYQRRFLSTRGQGKFWYLDLHPEPVCSGTHRYLPRPIRHVGPPSCFCERDLYTARLGDWASTDIERRFFGRIDAAGRSAIEYFATFEHPSVDTDAFYAAIEYLSVQKLRTPKGLSVLAQYARTREKNAVLLLMQQLQHMFCAVWTEAVWCILDASETQTKFIISDHPVTTYNIGCFPASRWCRGDNDPDVRLVGTHTLFPLAPEKILVLTNLSWARNPYGNPLATRPNPELFRTAVFNFTQVQTGRILSEIEVREINFIIKSRARRFIAAAEREWLYPENGIPSCAWDRLGGGYLLMPDPRSMTFSSEVVFGYDNGRTEAFDEYGRRPSDPGFRSGAPGNVEWESFLAFKGEYARVFGPKRRGRAFEFGARISEEDPLDFHRYHLSLEGRFKPPRHPRSPRRCRPSA